MEETEPRIPPDVIHLSATEVRASWSSTAARVAQQQVRVIVERYGMPEAVIISPMDFRRLLRVEQGEVAAGVDQIVGDTEEQTRALQIVRRLQAVATDILHTQVDELVNTVVRRILEEYGAFDTRNPPDM